MSNFLTWSDHNTDGVQIPHHYISLPWCLIFVGPHSSRTCFTTILWCLEFWSRVQHIIEFLFVWVTVVTCNVLMLHLLHQLGFSHYTNCYVLNMILYKYIIPLPPTVIAIYSISISSHNIQTRLIMILKRHASKCYSVYCHGPFCTNVP